MKHYEKGEPIRSLDELYKQDLIFFYGKITNRGWFQNWQLFFVQRHLNNGNICYANKISNEETPQNEQKQQPTSKYRLKSII